MISRIEFLHSKHMVHRDVKPDNFLTGHGSRASTVYLIDFGLAKPYRDPKSLRHIPYLTGKGLSGTARYTSIATHMGIEQSRRDDLEGIGYCLMYFILGGLPWQGMKVATPDECEKKNEEPPDSPKAVRAAKQRKEKAAQWDQKRQGFIGDRKISFGHKQLCAGQPIEFLQYFTYCTELRFEDKPDYEYLRNLLLKIEKQNGYKDDGVFDWIQVGLQDLEASAAMNRSQQRAGGRVRASSVPKK